MKKTLILSLMLTLLAAAAIADSGDLSVTVSGVRDAKGSVRLALYRDAKTFGKERKAVTIREAVAREGDVEITIRSLPPGRYAVFVYHDRNADREFDRRLGLIAAEGHGLSNNPGPDAGRDFAAAAFEVASGGVTALVIDLDYCHAGPDEERSLARSLKCWATLSD